jgi:hypothetical protein
LLIIWMGLSRKCWDFTVFTSQSCNAGKAWVLFK